MGIFTVVAKKQWAKPFIIPVQKEFYQIMLKERKEKILDYSMKLLIKQEQQTEI